MATELEAVLISALNEYVFYPRRCALKLIDGYREDNEHTSMGTLLHDHADEPGYETEAGVTLLRALPLFSNRYGLSGKADIVEVRKNFALRISDCELKQSDDERDAEILYAPVEYKKGKRRGLKPTNSTSRLARSCSPRASRAAWMESLTNYNEGVSDCLLQVTLFNGTKHQQIVCRVDSDTDECLFPASIGRSLGIALETVCLEFSTTLPEAS